MVLLAGRPDTVRRRRQAPRGRSAGSNATNNGVTRQQTEKLARATAVADRMPATRGEPTSALYATLGVPPDTTMPIPSPFHPRTSELCTSLRWKDWSGYHAVCSYVVSLFRPQIIRDLGLARHGLELIPLESSFTPLPDGRSLCRWPDSHRTRREIAEFSRAEADIYPEFGLAMTKMAQFSRQLIDAPAPDPASLNPAQIIRMLRLGRRFRDLGPDLM